MKLISLVILSIALGSIVAIDTEILKQCKEQVKTHFTDIQKKVVEGIKGIDKCPNQECYQKEMCDEYQSSNKVQDMTPDLNSDRIKLVTDIKEQFKALKESSNYQAEVEKTIETLITNVGVKEAAKKQAADDKKKLKKDIDDLITKNKKLNAEMAKKLKDLEKEIGVISKEHEKAEEEMKTLEKAYKEKINDFEKLANELKSKTECHEEMKTVLLYLIRFKKQEEHYDRALELEKEFKDQLDEAEIAVRTVANSNMKVSAGIEEGDSEEEIAEKKDSVSESTAFKFSAEHFYDEFKTDGDIAVKDAMDFWDQTSKFTENYFQEIQDTVYTMRNAMRFLKFQKKYNSLNKIYVPTNKQNDDFFTLKEGEFLFASKSAMSEIKILLSIQLTLINANKNIADVIKKKEEMRKGLSSHIFILDRDITLIEKEIKTSEEELKEEKAKQERTEEANKKSKETSEETIEIKKKEISDLQSSIKTTCSSLNIKVTTMANELKIKIDQLGVEEEKVRDYGTELELLLKSNKLKDMVDISKNIQNIHGEIHGKIPDFVKLSQKLVGDKTSDIQCSIMGLAEMNDVIQKSKDQAVGFLGKLQDMSLQTTNMEVKGVNDIINYAKKLKSSYKSATPSPSIKKRLVSKNKKK